MADFLLDCMFTAIKAGIGSIIFSLFYLITAASLRVIKRLL